MSQELDLNCDYSFQNYLAVKSWALYGGSSYRKYLVAEFNFTLVQVVKEALLAPLLQHYVVRQLVEKLRPIFLVFIIRLVMIAIGASY